MAVKHKIVGRYRTNRKFRFLGGKVGHMIVLPNQMIYLYDNGVFRMGDTMIPYADGRSLVRSMGVQHVSDLDEEKVTPDANPDLNQKIYEIAKETLATPRAPRKEPKKTKARVPIEESIEDVVKDEGPIKEVKEPKGTKPKNVDQVRIKPLGSDQEFEEQAEIVKKIEDDPGAKILVDGDDALAKTDVDEDPDPVEISETKAAEELNRDDHETPGQPDEEAPGPANELPKKTKKSKPKTKGEDAPKKKKTTKKKTTKKKTVKKSGDDSDKASSGE